jgi:putative YphP/YqiW family bacilliredoxin
MQYDPKLIQPFRDELTSLGFRELRTAEDVDAVIATQKGTNLIVINSVCGCAAGKARPGLGMALQRSPVRPDLLTTVFAGGDIEATARLRQHLGALPPSSPSMALFRDGQLLHFVPRYQIERRTAFEIAQYLMEVFKEYCSPQEVEEKRDTA